MTAAATLCVFLGAAFLTALFILLLRPWLQRYALAHPIARSSHRVPTPQGGGIAVIAAATITLGTGAMLAPAVFDESSRLSVLLACMIALACVGAIDDFQPIQPLPRLLLQAGAVVVLFAALPPELHLVSFLPAWFERILMFAGLLWLVNLVNFMDGIDWMTVAETVPLTAALGIFGLMGALPADATLVAFALCGTMVGFAPFNKPVARLFLGDVGSLPIGLLLGWLLISLGEHHLAAAMLLPLYYVADATITLMRRFARGEPVMQAHRGHFYQQAIDGKLSVYQVVSRVFTTNLALAVLAAAALSASLPLQILILLCGVGLVGGLLFSFSHRGLRRGP